MAEDSQQNTNPQQPLVLHGVAGMKVIQPSAELVEEMKTSQNTAPTQPATVTSPSNTEPVENPKQKTAVTPSSLYPQATKGVGIDATVPPPAATSGFTQSDSENAPVIRQVPALKKLVLFGVGLASIQLMLLLLLRGELVGGLALLKLTVHGALSDILIAISYVSQFSVILYLLYFLALTLSKSFIRVHKLLTLGAIFSLFSVLVNILSLNIIGIVVTIAIVSYILNVRSSVDLKGVDLTT